MRVDYPLGHSDAVGASREQRDLLCALGCADRFFEHTALTG